MKTAVLSIWSRIASGTLVIGVFSDKKPFGYVDENGDYQGYDVYFARRLAQDLGVELKLVSVDAPNRVEYLTSAKVDIILSNFTVTPARAEVVDFALPYMKVALGVVSPDSALITTAAQAGRQDADRQQGNHGGNLLCREPSRSAAA